MTPFAIRSVDHVAVSAPRELEGAVLDWYGATLGLERLVKPEGTRSAGGWFRAGEVEIHVTIEAAESARSGHFGVVVDDFHAAIEQLRSSGSTIDQATRIPGRQRCYTTDPAGNTIEIVGYDVDARA